MRSLLVATGALLLAACGQERSGNEAQGNAVVAEPGKREGSLASLLAAEPRFVALVRAAGMEPVLEGREPYTVLAPTAAALDALPPGTLERLQQPAARAELTGLLRRHILPGTVTQADLLAAVKGAGGTATLASMAGDPLTVSREGGGLRIADSNTSARLVGPESRASNGVIHRIDAVLPAPPTGTSSTAD
jgi:uncharacterized surface protein with fasciclin (FAS1) repeats